ncbi:MAG TPA: GlcNAc-PI de-N-acetylase [Propionibacterium sp.]|nr:GlcNAc-PI de-N-acetylase [Propionibacterium sp.]
MTDLFDHARVLFVHAHPDDETLATGGLIAELVARGVEVAVLTATRGEQGEVVDGPLSHLAGTPELTEHREGEVRAACATLGVRHHAFLGDPPARAADARPRRYTDSGMRWLDASETVAGPGDAAGPASLTSADPAEVVSDIASYARAIGADAIVSYDSHGGYGHPDHVALHEPSRAAASEVGVPFREVASEPDDDALATPHHLTLLQDALAHYASQLTVDGTDVVHVGGQRQPIQTRFTVRPGADPG